MSNEDKAAQDITEVLADIVKAVVGKFEMQDLLRQILDTTMNTLHAEVCSIFLRKQDNPNKIQCVAGSGFVKAIEGKAEYEITKDSGLTSYVAATGQPLNIKSTEELMAHPYKKGKHDYLQSGSSGGETRCRNLLALPLKIKDDEILGVIKVENKKEEFGAYFSEGDQRIFEIIANVTILRTDLSRSKEDRVGEKRTQKMRKYCLPQQIFRSHIGGSRAASRNYFVTNVQSQKAPEIFSNDITDHIDEISREGELP